MTPAQAAEAPPFQAERHHDLLGEIRFIARWRLGIHPQSGAYYVWPPTTDVRIDPADGSLDFGDQTIQWRDGTASRLPIVLPTDPGSALIQFLFILADILPGVGPIGKGVTA